MDYGRPSFYLPAMSRAARLAPRTVAYVGSAVAVVIGDFLTKRWAEAALVLHEPRQVAGNWLRLTLTYNTGAAMNLSLGGLSRIGFSALAAVMIGVMFQMYRTAPARDVWQPLALGLISGGALGNLADRLRSARGVVDFIDVGTPDWRFWTFNLADSGVTVGAALLLVAVLFRRAPRAPG